MDKSNITLQYSIKKKKKDLSFLIFMVILVWLTSCSFSSISFACIRRTANKENT